MSPLFQAPRGTSDRLPDVQSTWRYVQDTAEDVAAHFGYQRVDTPVFEDARLFVRGIGEVTDIVEKETYTFEDRGGDLITLRPEATAPVCRAYLEHGMHNLPQPVRLYYICPVFRYERPQAGRVRQHHQFGIEALGDGDPSVDAEVIELGWRLLERFGLDDVALKVNSTGDRECRPAYIETLQAHYRPHFERLCSNCKRRLDENPLRLLDCKEASCQPVKAEAPHSIDYLCGACEEHWNGLLGHLTTLEIAYEVDHTLARGFDYYTRTVFEIVPPGEGSQSVIVGGGRYDGLIEELGGRPTPGLGFGMGIERIMLNLGRLGKDSAADAATRVMIAHMGDEARSVGMKLASELRGAGIATVLAPSRALRGQLRYANANGASHAIVIGDDELAKGTVVVRDLVKSEQEEVASDQVVGWFTSLQAPEP